MLVGLRARGYQLLVVRPDPVSMELQVLGNTPGSSLAARIVHVERTLLQRKLQQAGIHVIDWHLDQPFDQVMHASLGRAMHWFRAIGWES